MNKSLITNSISIVVIIFTSYLLGYSHILQVFPKTQQKIPLQTPIPTPLNDYTFANLKSAEPVTSSINILSTLYQKDIYTAYEFSYQSNGQTITGQLNTPLISTPSAGFPVILLLRGWVDPSQYTTGIGTKSAANFFSSQGFVTLAPDFLGYGHSDPEDQDVMKARFRKPKDIINLLNSLQSLKFVDTSKIGIWAHSNGGQLALSTLEISEKPYPTTLWAPVSKSFPYSILYYTDESLDQGKALRQELAEFESIYNVDNFSITNYFDQIHAPVQIHQGTADDAVPLSWSQDLLKNLKTASVSAELFVYPNADHNLKPNWNDAIQRDLTFFQSHLSFN